ncbi:Por secretion system C-terminal sorting domain-containing protein [Cyclonatronum proteinivorum]|uniref:Por secretion system C-terminal sorting domain-containing protein n=1 Tax=Cyclonatronum proteinivorum TaxID=1457365 RepID=A0A345UJB4_9BACT|nr:T9SS type A sorting domain-containing protein [Cyclonatronum proteinivorum]AXJ00566.1 Por secretion system C-terminal sorting domain-containing protein [Cyclonatronum proteinivorum]
MKLPDTKGGRFRLWQDLPKDQFISPKHRAYFPVRMVLFCFCMMSLVLTDAVLAQNTLTTYSDDQDVPITSFEARIDAGSYDNWAILNSSPGVNGEIRALLRAEDYLYVGGSFSVPGTDISGFGRIDVATGEWEDLAFVCEDDCEVNALAALGNFVYVGGSCVWHDDDTSCGAIQRINVNTGAWGGIDTNLTRDEGTAVVSALAVSEGQLIAGGHFDRAGDTVVRNIARFRTSNRSWNRLGDGISEPVRALAINGERAYVGIELTDGATAGTTDIKGIAVYDYSGNRTNNGGWSNIGEITIPFRPGNAVVNALAVSGGNLYAGGYFDIVANGNSTLLAYALTAYNFTDESWRIFPDGRFDDVNAMTVAQGELIVTVPDIIDTPSQTPSALSLNIGEEELSWNGFGVQAFNSPAGALAADDDALYFGGAFTRAGSQTNTGGLAGYTTATGSWFIFGAPWGETEAVVAGGDILSFAVSDRDIIAGGSFTSAGGDDTVTRLGAFSTETRSWTGLGGGFGDGSVKAVAVSGDLVFAGGDFSVFADGTDAPVLAQFDRSTQNWTVLGDALSTPDEEDAAVVHALAADHNRLIVGGSFSEAAGITANNIAIYTADSGWNSLNAPFDAPVYALALRGSTLFAAGAFTQPATGLAMYDFETGVWTGIGGIADVEADDEAVVYALHNKAGLQLYVGGNFALGDGLQHFGVLNLEDMSWQQHAGSPSGPVFDLAVYGDNVYLSGDFSGAGSAEGSAHIVRRNWVDQQWLNIASGTDGPVFAVQPYADELFLGGSFSSPAAGFTSWTGVSGFVAGAGTATHPFEVATLFEVDRVRWFFESHFAQTQDLLFSPSVRLNPLGTNEYPFMGVWQGNDFAVHGFTYVCITTVSCGNRPRAQVGFFGKTDGALIENTHLVDARIIAILGEGLNVGGLVGHSHDTIIRNSSVTAEVSGRVNVGGFVGQTSGNTLIENSFAAHRIGRGSSSGTAGLSGIENVGGFVGLHAGLLIQDAFAHGSIQNATAEHAGGFAGLADLDAEILRAYAAVHFPQGASGSSTIGGFIGTSLGASVQDAYWDTELSTLDTDILASPLTTAEMQSAASFENFGFGTNWEIIEGRTFPWLKQTGENTDVGSGTYGTVIAAGPRIEGDEGWRYFGMSFPGNQSYAEFTRFLQTQGFPGSNVPPGISNMYYYATNNRWRPLSNISPSGAGTPQDFAFAMYVFAPPLSSEIDVHAIVSQYRKPAQEQLTPVKGFTVNQLPDDGAPEGGVWTLMANNNLWPMDTDALNRSGLSEAVYVYDNTIPGYRSWNGLAGELENGVIEPFTAFFVETLETDASLEIPADALILDPDAERNSSDKPALRLIAESDGLNLSEGTAWLTFSGRAQPQSARQLQPMDVRAHLEVSLESDGRLWDILDVGAVPATQEEVRVPLSVIRYEVTEAGDSWQAVAAEVSLRWEGLDRFPADWGIGLVDTQTGEVTNLREKSAITLQTAVSQQARTAPRTLAEATAIASVPAERDAPMAARYELLVRPGSGLDPNEQTELPEAVALEQNYPNPFNPATTIRYSLPEAADVRLEVYNLLGQRVATLVSGTVDAGVHTVSFDASALSSGVYLYRLQTSGMVLSRKMLLVK